jgi:hypothetical protein
VPFRGDHLSEFEGFFTVGGIALGGATENADIHRLVSLCGSYPKIQMPNSVSIAHEPALWYVFVIWKRFWP